VPGVLLLNGRLGPLHALRFVFAEVALVNELANLLLTQVVVALIHRDLVNPGEQARTEIKVADREVDFREDLLRDIFGIVMIPEDPVDNGKDFGLADESVAGLLSSSTHHLGSLQFCEAENSLTTRSLPQIFNPARLGC